MIDEERPEGAGGAPPPFGLSGPPEPPPWPTEPPRADRDGPAWEWWPQLGFGRALLKTIGEVLGHPDETFGRARRVGGLRRPLAFLLLASVATRLLNFLLMLPFMPLLRGIAQQAEGALRRSGLAVPYGSLSKAFNPATSVVADFFGLFVFYPLGLLIWIFLFAGLTHLFLVMYGGARYSFETTFRALAYAAGGCAVLALIPLCGTLVSTIALAIVGSIALARMHETDSWRAVLAILTPGILIVLCVVGLIAGLIMVMGFGR